MKVTLEQVVLAGMDPRDADGKPLTGEDGKPVKSPLGRLVEEANEARLCVRTLWHIAKLVRCVRDQMEPFNETRNGLILKYGKKDEKGETRVLPTDPNWADFQREHRELLDAEVDLDVEEVVLPPEAQGFSVDTLVALDGLVVVRGEDKPKNEKKGKSKKD